MSSSHDAPGMSRRELLRSAILLVGGVATGLPDTLWAKDVSAKRFFSAAQFALLDEVSEIIIPQTDTPGARGADVPSGFDALMSHWASPQRRVEFRTLLDDIDQAAVAQAGKPLLALTPAQRIDVVTAYDAARIGSDEIYGKFKSLVLTLYYLSEVGATQELRYEHAPGAWEPAVKVTPETRSWAGTGFF